MDKLKELKEYCFEHFENVESNIFKIIEDDMDDEMVLLKIHSNIPYPNSYISKDVLILVDRKLAQIFLNLNDHIYDIDIIDDIQKKMEYMEKEIHFLPEDEKQVNRFCSKTATILLLDDDKEFWNYLLSDPKIKEDEFSDLVKYSQIVSEGWIKPKFTCVKTLLNTF